MNTRQQQFGFKQKALVVALMATFGVVHAGDDQVAQLTSPDTASIGIGAAALTGDQKDRSIFGQYSGWSDDSSGLLLDFEYLRRDDATGTWVSAQGRNIGLDNRELSYSREKQGDWKVSAQYNELVRHDPRTLNTGLQGIGSAQLTVNALATPGAGTDSHLDIKRRGFSLGGEKWINSGLLLEASVKTEAKEGTRLSGVGAYCGPGLVSGTCPSLVGALLMVPEPIDSTTLQMEAKANFVGKGYSLTAGYYGSVYQNNIGSVRLGAINGNLVNLTGAAAPNAATYLSSVLTQPIALAPDNQAHQIYVSGNYALTPTVRTTFNYALTHATQTQNFSENGLTPAAGLPADLGGVVDTTLAQLGVTAKPIQNLSLLANVRYEDTRDKTPQAKYGGIYSNALNSSSKANSKAEATYSFPENLKGTVGVEYAWVKRDLPAAGSTVLIIPTTSLTSVREVTNEMTYRAELRKPLSETVNASLAYLTSKRDGSRWIDLTTYQTVRNGDVYSAVGVFPTTMMDRNRDKWRLMVDWLASDKLSMQFTLEDGRDKYTAPTTKGLHSTGMTYAGLDASFNISDSWKTTAYISYGEQSIHVDHNAGYIATLRDISNSIGFGVTGKLNKQWTVGADLSYLDDRNSYGLDSGNADAPGVLPDVNYRAVALKLFGRYALEKNADIQFDLVHQNASFNEWTWANGNVPFAYSDNSTVAMQANQKVTYLGVKYVYRFK